MQPPQWAVGPNWEPAFVVALNVVERCALMESLPANLQQAFLDRFPLPLQLECRRLGIGLDAPVCVCGYNSFAREKKQATKIL